MEGINIDRIGDELANAYLEGLKDGEEHSASKRKKAINEELEFAPEYDGHKPKDIVRLLSILKQDKLGVIEE